MLNKTIQILVLATALNTANAWQEMAVVKYIETHFKQKISAIVFEDYWFMAKDFEKIDSLKWKQCIITSKKVTTILTNKVSLTSYACKTRFGQEKYILWQSIWPKIKYWSNQTCQNTDLYFLAQDEILKLGKWASIIDKNKKNHWLFLDGNCEDLNIN